MQKSKISRHIIASAVVNLYNNMCFENNINTLLNFPN